jgi:hypothetical protein
MIRTQIQLPEYEYETLKEMAHKTHRSMADCVREAVAVYIAASHNSSNDFAAVSGQFSPISTNDLKPHDQMLADSFNRQGGQ